MNDTTTIPSEGLTLDELQRNPFADEQSAQYGSPEEDKKLMVRFYLHPVEQAAASIKAGRKIYKDTEYVEILIPGDKHSIIKRPAFAMDKRRFADAYARFQAGQHQQIQGTPLSTLVWMTESRAKEYEFFNILTVEQLAQASDGSQVASMMGFVDDKRKAQSFLSTSSDDAPIIEMRAKLDERDAELELLKEQMAQMAARMNAPAESETEKRGPGRPPKG